MLQSLNTLRDGQEVSFLHASGLYLASVASLGLPGVGSLLTRASGPGLGVQYVYPDPDYRGYTDPERVAENPASNPGR